jgi:hypothetical protein
MKTKLLITVILFVLTITCFGQHSPAKDNWTWLMGNWQGEGSGRPGQGGGTFSFSYDLDNKIIIRKSHSQYPATSNQPETIHDDLMVIYPDANDSLQKAIYFDNEGHIINYSVTYADKAIIFVSEKNPQSPVFRLTYTLLVNEQVNTKFELSRDGENFMTYIEGKSKKTN